jgi:hypothetical protein
VLLEQVPPGPETQVPLWQVSPETQGVVLEQDPPRPAQQLFPQVVVPPEHVQYGFLFPLMHAFGGVQTPAEPHFVPFVEDGAL